MLGSERDCSPENFSGDCCEFAMVVLKIVGFIFEVVLRSEFSESF